MRNYLLGVWKTFVITATGLIFAWLANHGIKLSDEQTTWLTVGLISAGLAGYNFLVNWLLARPPVGPWNTAARILGKVLSLGGEAPRYPATPATLKTSETSVPPKRTYR